MALRPEGLRQLINLPPGSAEAELGGLMPLVQVYQYLEATRSWDVLGGDIEKSSADLRGKIKQGEEELHELMLASILTLMLT